MGAILGGNSVSGDGRTGRKDRMIEEYCRKASRWIPCTWNGEIPLILELPLGFSVAKAGAGAKNGDFWRGHPHWCLHRSFDHGSCCGC